MFKSHWPCDHGRLSLDKMLALWLGNGDEHRPLESNTTGQKLSRGTFTFTFKNGKGVWTLEECGFITTPCKVMAKAGY